MSDPVDFDKFYAERCREILAELKSDEVVGVYIDDSLPVPKAFRGSGPIRLVILGQDPTVEELESRRRVETVLTLDRPGSNLYRFVERVCEGLRLKVDLNVYATNVCKNFFTEPPVGVKAHDLIARTWPKWRDLLLAELDRFPDATIITLGKPILGVLVQPPAPQDLKHYWGYVEGWKSAGRAAFRSVEANESTIGRRFFPLPHVTNSASTALYRTYFDEYLSFIRSAAMKEAT